MGPCQAPASISTHFWRHCHCTVPEPGSAGLSQLNLYTARLPSGTPGSMILGYAYSPWDTVTQVRTHGMTHIPINT